MCLFSLPDFAAQLKFPQMDKKNGYKTNLWVFISARALTSHNGKYSDTYVFIHIRREHMCEYEMLQMILKHPYILLRTKLLIILHRWRFFFLLSQSSMLMKFLPCHGMFSLWDKKAQKICLCPCEMSILLSGISFTWPWLEDETVRFFCIYQECVQHPM